VERNGLAHKTRQFTVTSGFGPEHNLGVYNNSVDTIERAFIERYFLCKEGDGFRPALSVRPRAFQLPQLQEFQNVVLMHMPKLPRISRQQVVDTYRGPKRRVYEQAMLSLEVDPLDIRDSRLTSFVKLEKQDVGKAPRVINPRSPRYNLELGRYLKLAEHHYFTAINKTFRSWTSHTVIKGLNADRSAEVMREKWDRFDSPVAIGLDATKFDMHVSVAALKYEHLFYKRLFPGDHTLKKLLRWQLVNKGIAYAGDGRVKFTMVGTRSSGDLNTSLGNCLIMCSLIYAYSSYRGVDIELANNGDDCVVILEASDLAHYQVGLTQWFRRRGFAMTVEEPVYEFEQVEFCQTHPVQVSTGWRMVRNLVSCVTKDPMCLITIPNEIVLRKWYHAIGTCGTILTTGVPVLHSMYRVFLRHGTACSTQMMQYVFRNRSQLQLASGVGVATMSDIARVSFYYAFGITPDVQLAIEQYYDGLVVDVQLSHAIERDYLYLIYQGII
jgi:hypothetical protein